MAAPTARSKTKNHLPIIFLTGHGDIALAVRTIKAGAIDFLTKPFRNQDLLDAVSTALQQDKARRANEQLNSTLQESFKSLSARERDVVARVAAGGLNKQIAADLGVSEVTVKVHRAKAMRKLRAKSVAELVRITDRLGVTPSKADTRSDTACLFCILQESTVHQQFSCATKLIKG
jgi:FixJ family two-component response regulator